MGSCSYTFKAQNGKENQKKILEKTKIAIQRVEFYRILPKYQTLDENDKIKDVF